MQRVKSALVYISAFLLAITVLPAAMTAFAVASPDTFAAMVAMALDYAEPAQRLAGVQ